MAAIPTTSETNDDAAGKQQQQKEPKTHEQQQYDKYCHYLSEAQRKRNAAKNTMRSYRTGSHSNAAQLKREAAGLKQRAKRLKESEIRKGNEAARDWQEPTF